MSNPNIRVGEFGSITSLNEDASPANNDLVATWDISAEFFKKIQLGNLPVNYTDRGDPTAWDKTSWTTDANWHDWDLSSIVPAGTKLVHLRVHFKDDAPGNTIRFRKNGNVDTFNAFYCVAPVANVDACYDGWVVCDSNRVIEYLASNTTFTYIYAVVRGYIK